MQDKALSKTLHVGPQLSSADFREAASRGFKTIINNRPDNEEAGQPRSAELAAIAEQCGLNYYHVPVTAPDVREADLAKFREAISEGSAPVLAFCRSGARSTMLWALTADDGIDTDVIIATARGAGYDLSGLYASIDARRQSSATSRQND